MKFKNLLSTALVILISLGLSAQIPYLLNGTLTDPQGNPVANQSITWWFSPNAPITGGPTGTMITDANGIFSDTSLVNTPSGWFLLTTTDCDNSVLADSFFVQNAMGGGFVTVSMLYCDTVTTPPPPCNADFTSGQSPAGNGTLFTMNFPQPNTTYYWSFGDGSYDTTSYPATQHMYAQTSAGYLACVTMVNANCTATSCDSVFVNGPPVNPQSIVNGFVQVNNGFASSATVYLIEFDTTSGGILTAIDTVQTQQGFYQFDSVPQGWYLVKAALNSSDPDYLNYLPTYFGMASGTLFGPTLFWFNAQPVMPTPNAQQVGFGIAMIPGTNPGGPGFVGGLVSQGANKTAGPGDGLENVLVMLLDMNEDPITYTYTNDKGEFGFDNLAYGDYKVYTEVSGIMTTPVNVTIDATNPSVDLVDVIISSNGVNGTVGVRSLSVVKNRLEIYPNPAKEQVNIELEKTGLSTFRILDLTGKEVLNGSSYHDRVSIDLGGLSEGMYIIQLTNSGELFQSKLVIE